MIEGEKILITGPTGQVAHAIAVELAKKNDVHALARFGKPGSRDRLERHGMQCIAGDFVADDLGSLIDDDYDRVLHFAVYQQAGKADFEYAIEVNAVGTGKLMYHTRKTKSFLYCSTCSVYKPRGRIPRAEDDPLGEGLPVSPTYGPSKLAGEAVVKFLSQQFGVPATIGRLNAAYGNAGGLPAMHLAMLRAGKPIPLSADAPNLYSPLHEDDYVRQAVMLLEAASVPPVVVNWCGSQAVAAEDWCEFMAGLIGVKAEFGRVAWHAGSNFCDTTRMHALIGETKVDWRDGMRRLVEATPTEKRYPSGAVELE